MRDTRVAAGGKMYEVGPQNAGDAYGDFKKTKERTDLVQRFPHGFIAEDVQKMDGVLKDVKVQIAMKKAVGNVQALKAALPNY